MKVGLPLMKSVLKLKELPLAKGVLIPIGSTAAASGTDTGIYKKKILGLGRPMDSAQLMTTMVISNEEIEVIMKIVNIEFTRYIGC